VDAEEPSPVRGSGRRTVPVNKHAYRSCWYALMHKHARPVKLPDVIVIDCLLPVWTSFVALSLTI
jgi:hypothetical protein